MTSIDTSVRHTFTVENFPYNVPTTIRTYGDNMNEEAELRRVECRACDGRHFIPGITVCSRRSVLFKSISLSKKYTDYWKMGL